MFQLRTEPRYLKIQKLIKRRATGADHARDLIITDCVPHGPYYASGGWRATWKGGRRRRAAESVPAQLDTLAWLCGMPNRVRGFCGLGRYHNIEVEDDVNRLLGIANGATGMFVTSTGEAPGTKPARDCRHDGKSGS